MGDSSSASSYRVLALEVLKGQSRAEEARDILTRVAKQVGCGCCVWGGYVCGGGRWVGWLTDWLI